MMFLEMLLIVIAAFVSTAVLIFFAVRLQASKGIIIFCSTVITGLYVLFLYNYDMNLGYAVDMELPESFRLLGYTQYGDDTYVWIVAEGSQKPRTHIVHNLTQKERQELRKGKQKIDEGMYVKGAAGKNGNNPHDNSRGLTVEIVDPKNVIQK